MRGYFLKTISAISILLIYASIEIIALPSTASAGPINWDWIFSDTVTRVTGCSAFNSDGICSSPIITRVPITGSGILTTASGNFIGSYPVTNVTGTFNGAVITGMSTPAACCVFRVTYPQNTPDDGTAFGFFAGGATNYISHGDFYDAVIQTPNKIEVTDGASFFRATPICSSILDKAVTISNPVNATLIANFSPNGGLSLAESACGYSSFNWQQKVLHDPDPPKSALTGQKLPTSYDDPPKGGYVKDDGTTVYAADRYPFYYSNGDLESDNCRYKLGDGTLVTFSVQDDLFQNFCDTPNTPGIVANEYVLFNTVLVGICAINIPGRCAAGDPDPIYRIRWTDNFDATTGAGGIAFNGETLRSNFQSDIDPNGGSGGIQILEAGPVTQAPEPSSIILFTSGLFGLFLLLLFQATPQPNENPCSKSRSDTMRAIQ